MRLRLLLFASCLVLMSTLVMRASKNAGLPEPVAPASHCGVRSNAAESLVDAVHRGFNALRSTESCTVWTRTVAPAPTATC